MFCPRCRSEFKKGIKICPTCNLSLEHSLPESTVSVKKSLLNLAIILVIVGYSYFFLIRILGTIFPGLFHNQFVIKSIQILSFLAAGSIVFFFISFYREFIKAEQNELKVTTILTIIGSAVLLLFYLKGIYMVFTGLQNFIIEKHPLLHDLAKSDSVDIFSQISVWLTSLFVLLFFNTFYKQYKKEKMTVMKKAVFWGYLGSAVSFLIRSFSFFIFLFYAQSRVLMGYKNTIYFILFPFVAFGFITIIYFLIIFYSEQQKLVIR